MSWVNQSFPSAPPAESEPEQSWRSRIGSAKAIVIASLILALFLVIGIAVVVVQKTSDSSANESKKFERLVLAINSGERFLEDDWMPTMQSADRSLSRAPIGEFSVASWERWDSGGGISAYLDAVRIASSKARSDLMGVTSELVALPFSKDPKLDQARDAALEHYEAWRTAVTDVYDSVYDYFYGGDFEDEWPYMNSFPEARGYTNTPAQERISPTFKSLCSSLSDAQPGNQEFESQIRDICDD